MKDALKSKGKEKAIKYTCAIGRDGTSGPGTAVKLRKRKNTNIGNEGYFTIHHCIVHPIKVNLLNYYQEGETIPNNALFSLLYSSFHLKSHSSLHFTFLFLST